MGPFASWTVCTGEMTVLPGMELMDCPKLAVPLDVMHHVVSVESSFNPYAIGVVGGRLARQPANLSEALATVRMLESRGFNFSLGLAQVNRYNLARYGLASYEQAFQACPNLQAGARILAECHGRSGHDWGKSFSCYYSGNFTTGFREGYVQKIYASMRRATPAAATAFPGAIAVYGAPTKRRPVTARYPVHASDRRVADTPAAAPERVAAAPSPSIARPAAPPPVGDRDTVAVLQPDGQAPRLVDAPGDRELPPAATSAAPAGDAAFVF